MYSSRFRCPKISQVNSQILYSCPKNARKSEFQGQGPCSKLSSIQTQSKKLISYLLPQLAHGLSRLAGGASRCVKGELAQRNFLDFISLLPCPKAGQCSAEFSPDAARLTPNGYNGIFGKTPCVLGSSPSVLPPAGRTLPSVVRKQSEASRSGPHPPAPSHPSLRGLILPSFAPASRRRAPSSCQRPMLPPEMQPQQTPRSSNNTSLTSTMNLPLFGSTFPSK